MLSPEDREIRLGIWKIHILHHAAARPVWGTWLLQELLEHGHELSPGTLYPALSRMERNGWLEQVGATAHSRARRSFRITASGRRLLALLRREVRELYDEVVRGQEPGPGSNHRGERKTVRRINDASARNSRGTRTKRPS